MRHTIISWDCSFRNFFNLIDGLLSQNFNPEDFELIYVEQRTQQYADAFSHSIGLKSLWDRYNEVKELLNIKVLYLGDDLEYPYHLGKCVNYALKEARGEVISIMDGDLLLNPTFLRSLDAAHELNKNAVINLHRVNCNHPVGASKSNWKKSVIDYEKCLAITELPEVFPDSTGNKGPLISARKIYWDQIGGYDESIIWSTSASTSGMDVCTRLEIVTNSSSFALQDSFAVHPWHPIGYAALNRMIEKSDVNKLLNVQKKITSYSLETGTFNCYDREEYTNKVYEDHHKDVMLIVSEEKLHDEANYRYTVNGYPISLRLKDFSHRLKEGIKNSAKKIIAPKS